MTNKCTHEKLERYEDTWKCSECVEVIQLTPRNPMRTIGVVDFLELDRLVQMNANEIKYLSERLKSLSDFVFERLKEHGN